MQPGGKGERASCTVANRNASTVPNSSDPTDTKPYGPTKAAALQYDREKSSAPRLTARGRGLVAEKIIAMAEENNIPLYRDRDLIEILDKTEIDTEIPLEVYAVVAEIFAFIYQANKAKKEAL